VTKLGSRKKSRDVKQLSQTHLWQRPASFIPQTVLFRDSTFSCSIRKLAWINRVLLNNIVPNVNSPPNRLRNEMKLLRNMISSWNTVVVHFTTWLYAEISRVGLSLAASWREAHNPPSNVIWSVVHLIIKGYKSGLLQVLLLFSYSELKVTVPV
jgi:hypothetical protein